MKKKALLSILLVIVTMPFSFAQIVYEVTINNGGFSPQSLEIEESDIVRWYNNTSDVQNVTSGDNCDPDGMWNSGSIVPGDTYSETFAEVDGTFSYFNDQNCNMTGTIVVKPTVVQGVLAADRLRPGLKAYPNPAAGAVSIDYALLQPSEVSIELRNMTGQKILSLKDHSFQAAGNYSEKVDLSSIEADAVMCIITTDKGSNTTIIMKGR